MRNFTAKSVKSTEEAIRRQALPVAALIVCAARLCGRRKVSDPLVSYLRQSRLGFLLSQLSLSAFVVPAYQKVRTAQVLTTPLFSTPLHPRQCLSFPCLVLA